MLRAFVVGRKATLSDNRLVDVKTRRLRLSSGRGVALPDVVRIQHDLRASADELSVGQLAIPTHVLWV
jgi:hypothetical protein